MRNLKRALSLGLTAAMISGLMVMGSSAASSSYTDVADTNNVEAIEVLKAVGVMVGDENGNFNPDQNVTRNEMAVIMANLMEYNVASYKNTSPFTDVPSWAEPYVAACYTNGITSGYSDTVYGGSDTVTTAQAALMLMKALGYFQYASDFGSDWQLATTRQGNDIDLFVGVDSGVTAPMTRNDVAQLVLNTLKSGTVQAETDGSFQIGDVVINRNVKYNYITSGQTYHRVKLILKIYRDVVWVLSERAEELHEYAWELGNRDADAGLCYLENFAPDIDLQEFEEKVCCVMESRMLVDVIDRALLRLKRYPDRGELYYEILTKQFIHRFNSTEKELLDELNMERSVFYDRKREALFLFSVCLFGYAVPELQEELDAPRLFPD